MIFNHPCAEHYLRNNTGHAADCRRRIVPTLFSEHRALDTERCDRCRYLLSLLGPVT
jgi:hypothetical protein